MAFTAAHPTFRTPDLDKARAVAQNLVEGRKTTPRALFPHEAESWVAQRFPGLSPMDQALLTIDVKAWIGS